jgi:hypothetical protein
LVEMRVALKAG